MKRMVALVAVVVGLAVWPGSVLAASSAGNRNISQSYTVRGTVETGAIVSLVNGSSDTVEAANTTNAQRIIGVAVTGDSSLVAVNPDASKTQVATSGTAVALVSTVDGSIAAGDAISVSPFSGIGMRAATAASDGSYVIGRAQQAFDQNSSTAVRRQVADKNGTKQMISVGFVPVTIVPGFAASSQKNAGQQTGLQKFAQSLTGHAVSTPRVIASLVIASLTVVAVVVLMYASIYGSIISIGRNPLAQGAVLKALTSVLALAALATFIAFLLVFFLLR